MTDHPPSKEALYAEGMALLARAQKLLITAGFAHERTAQLPATLPASSYDGDLWVKVSDVQLVLGELAEQRRENVRWENAHKIVLDELERQKRDMAAAVEEIRRLRAENAGLDQRLQTDALSVHAEKWVKRALKLQEQVARLKQYICVTALAGYRCAPCAERLTAEPAPKPERVQGGLVEQMRIAGYHEWATAVERLERELAELETHIIRALPPLKVTPAHEREMPHCSTCSCPPYESWQPIETAPTEGKSIYWVVPLTAEETYRDSSGNPKATHWMPLPAAPSQPPGAEG